MSDRDGSVIIVDTTVWIDYFAERDTAQTAWLDGHLESDEMGYTSLILCELLQGIRDEFLFKKTEHILMSEFAFYDGMSRAIAISSARNFKTLRSRGVTIRKTVDCLIASFCIERGFRLLHNDRDFDPFEEHLGLKVIRG
jgi:hypothetical protein